MNKPIVAVIAAVLLLGAPMAAASAHEEGDTKKEVNVTDDRAEIIFEREIDEQEAKVEITFDTEDAGFLVKAEQKNASAQIEDKLEAHLHQLVEFEDANDNGAYDEGENVTSSWLLSQGSEQVVDGPENGTVTWRALNVTDVEADDGTPGKHIRGRATFQAADDPLQGLTGELLGTQENRTFGVDLYVFGAFVSFNGSELQPTEVKVDLRVDNYPYAENGTQLGLILDTKSESSAKVEDGQGTASSHELGDLTANLAFTWAETAQVDGTDEPVHTTEFASEDGSKNQTEGNDTASEREVKRTFALSYARGEEIVHDPRVGATLVTAGGFGGDTIDQVPGPGALVLLGTLALAGAAVRRRI